MLLADIMITRRSVCAKISQGCIQRMRALVREVRGVVRGGGIILLWAG
jgi:hypothetical protein